MGNIREIERLYRLEYGDVGEFRFRMIGTFFGAGIIWLYTGWMLAWVWVASYAALQFAFFLFLRAKLKKATLTDVRVARFLFPLLLISFLWMPILMIASPDDALSVSGFCILSGVIVFVVRRSEENLTLMLLEIAVLAVCLSVGAGFILVRYEDPIAWLGLIFGVATLVFYVTQAAVIIRQQRIRADQIAARTRQAEKLEAIGKLAGGVAHDFNNLLTVILGNLDLVREIRDQDALDELVENAREATLRGATVVRQLLAYARQTDGTSRTVDVGDVLRSVKTLCKTFIPSSITMTVSLPTKAICVNVDDAQLLTALLNLIKNSVDAIEGPGLITVSATTRRLLQPLNCMSGQQLPAGYFVEIAVSDSGIGIPPDLLHRVADPFFTTKEVGKGSGLGLSMVSGFVIQAGGGFQIQSGKKGTQVCLLLPEVPTAP